MNSFVSSCHHSSTVVKKNEFGLSDFYCYDCGEKCYLVAPLWLDRDEIIFLNWFINRHKCMVYRQVRAEDIELRIFNLLNEASQ